VIFKQIHVLNVLLVHLLKTNDVKYQNVLQAIVKVIQLIHASLINTIKNHIMI